MMRSISDFPTSANTLQAGLPHRQPMVWIRSVTAVTEAGGTCQVLLKPGSSEFSEQGLRQSTLLEWMAQGFGFASYAFTRLIPKQTYLAQAQNLKYCSSKEWELFSKAALQGIEAFVEGKLIRQLGPISLIESEVYWNRPEKIILATGQLKLFKGDGP